MRNILPYIHNSNQCVINAMYIEKMYVKKKMKTTSLMTYIDALISFFLFDLLLLLLLWFLLWWCVTSIHSPCTIFIIVDLQETMLDFI